MSTTLIQIKHYQIPDRIVFECQVQDDVENKIKYAVEEAVRQKKSLAYADLSGADLSHANLSHANLSHADLSYCYFHETDLHHADLYHANLSYANFIFSELFSSSFQCATFNETNIDGESVSKIPTVVGGGLRWHVIITEEYMRIGCQRHKHEEWKSFNDRQISSMDEDALEFWNRYSVVLLSMCDIQSK